MSDFRIFSPKDPGEEVPITFDFTDDLNQGEALTGTPSFSNSVYRGEPDANIAAMSTTPAQIIASGTKVAQFITGGVDGNWYGTKATCQTSSGRTLSVGGILKIIQSFLQKPF